MRIAILLSAVMLAVGCSSYEVTQTGRRYTDQATSTRAITMAVEDMEIPEKIVGKNVSLEIVTPGSPDENYLKRCLELKLLEQGVKLVSKPEEADFLLVILAETSGTDVGRANIEFPVPFAGANVTLYAHVVEKGYTRLRPFLLDAKNHLDIQELDLAQGQSQFKRMKIGVFDLTKTDIHDGGTKKESTLGRVTPH